MRKDKRKRIPLLIELSPELYRSVVEYSEAHGKQTKASIVRYALQVFLSGKRV